MKNIKLEEECINCIIKKYLNQYPQNADYTNKITYMQGVLKILSEATVETSAPILVEKINLLQEDLFGARKDYGDEKRYFNSFVLSVETDIQKKIESSKEPVKTALRYAMIGNYIDFGTLEDVSEEKLIRLLDTAQGIKIDEEEFSQFEKDLKSAKRLVYLTDNCGEIVLDKLLIKAIKKAYPELRIQVLVRGLPVLNDATLDDVRQIGLDKICEVYSNGTGIAGTCIDRISDEAQQMIEEADLLLAKGQGNFETLRFCNKNVYYAFMCKCMMFAQKFGVPQFSGIFANDLRM